MYLLIIKQNLAVKIAQIGPNAHPFFISVNFLSDQIMKSSYQIPYQSLNLLAIRSLSDQNINNFLKDCFAVLL